MSLKKNHGSIFTCLWLTVMMHTYHARAYRHRIAQIALIADTGSHQLSNNKPGNTIVADTFREYILYPGESIAKKITGNLFLKAHPEKKDCYIGEPIVVTYKLYSRLPATSSITKQPRLAGFSVYDLDDFISLSESIETVNNKTFRVHVLKRSQLLPIQTGNLSIDPMELNNSVHFVKMSTDDTSQPDNLTDLFDHLAQEETAPSVDYQFKILSGSSSINVHAFPEANRPLNFNGAIGSFTINASVFQKNITAKDAAILKVEISGKGNLPMIDAPVVDWPKDVEVLDITPVESFDKSVAPLQGSKTFEYRFSPVKSGECKIPAVSFSYFDASSKSYKTIHSQSNILTVNVGGVANAITSKIDPVFKRNTLFSTAMVMIVLVAMFCIMLWYWYKRPRTVIQTTKVEPTVNSEVLWGCASKLTENNFKGFYDCLGNEIWKLLADKTGLNPSELNKTNITTELGRRGWTNEMTESLHDILTKSERSRYLPGYVQDTDASVAFKQAEDVIKWLTSGHYNGDEMR